MDFLTQQFIAAAKRIRGELRDIGEKLSVLHNDIEQQTETIRTNYERSEQQQNTQPPIQISAELHTPEDVQRARQANENRHYRLQKWLTVGTWLAFGAAATYAGIAARQLQQMKRATDAAKQAADAAQSSARTAADILINAQKQFQVEQRPIIWLTNELDTPEFVVNAKATGTGQIVWNWRSTNYGKTPAKDTRYYQRMKIGDEGWALSYGEKGADFASPLPPGKVDFATVISKPGITKSRFDELLSVDRSISIWLLIKYTDAYDGNYETSICLSRLRSGAILYCRERNYIK